MRVVAGDIGRSAVKFVTESQLGMFDSVVGEYRDLKSDLRKGDMILQHEGKRYFVGPLAERESEFPIKDQRATKIHQRTKLLAIAAMHKCVDDRDEVLLSTGVPIGDHTAANKEALKQLLTGEYTATLNGITKTWTVKEVVVTAEGAVSVWGIPDIPETVHVIDPGSRKSNFAVMHKRGLWDRMSGSLDLGCETVGNMQPALFADSMAGMLSKRWLYQWGPLLVIGGMAETLQSEFERYYKDVIVPDNPRFASARGMYEVGVRVRFVAVAANTCAVVCHQEGSDLTEVQTARGNRLNWFGDRLSYIGALHLDQMG